MFTRILKFCLAAVIFSTIFSVNTLVSAKSAQTTQTLKTSGACTATDRQKVMYESNYRFAEVWDHCGRKNFGSADATVQCIQEAFPALSDACAACTGAMTACSKSHCTWECLTNSRNPDCLDCTRQHCRPALLKCTGLSDKELPKFPPNE